MRSLFGVKGSLAVMIQGLDLKNRAETWRKAKGADNAEESGSTSECTDTLVYNIMQLASYNICVFTLDRCLDP